MNSHPAGIFRIRYHGTKKDQYRWSLFANNENLIAESGGDGYKNKADCLHAIDLVKKTWNSQTIDETEEK